METKELKVQVPEGYEIDKENSTFECIKFKPIKKDITYEYICNEMFKEGNVLIDKDHAIYLSTGIIINGNLQAWCLFADGTAVDCGIPMYPGPMSLLKLASVEERNKFYSALVKEGYKYDKEQHTLVKQEFKPFEKVLVRNDTNDIWFCSLFSQYFIHQASFKYCCVNGEAYKFCIPYEGNEYLLGTKDTPTKKQ